MKKILTFFLLLFGLTSFGQLATINVGTAPNAGNGDPLRTAFIKANAAINVINVTRLYQFKSSLPTALNLKAPKLNASFTGTFSMPSPYFLNGTAVTVNGLELNILDGALVTYTELNKLVGIGTDTIATRAYARTFGGAMVALPDSDTYVNGYLSNYDGRFVDFTSSGQTQMDDKAPLVNANLTGTTNISKLQVGNSASNTKAEVDSVVIYNGKRYTFIGTDTIPDGLLNSQKVNLAGIIGNYATSVDTTYLHARIDSLVIQVNNQQTEIDALWIALNTLAGATDIQPPLFQSAEIGTFNDSIVVMIMNAGDIQQDSVPPITAFELTEDGTVFGLSSVSIGHDTVYITLDSTAIAGATYFLDYTKVHPYLQDSSANLTPNWVNKTVTNNIGFTAEYQTIYDAFTFKPTSLVANAQDVLVDSLTTYGSNYLSRMDVLLVPATSYNDGGEALMWWNDVDSTATNTTGTIWTALEGYTGDGLTDYINSYYNPDDSVNFGRNDGTVGIYLRSNIVEDDAYVFGSYQAGVGTVGFRPRKTGNLSAAWMNATTSLDGTNIITNSSGLFIVTRTLPSGAGASKVYQNGVQIDSETDASTGVPNSAMHILRRNGASSYSANQFSIFFVMDGVTDSEAAQLNRFFETYMDAIGKGVQ
jgi:hypothetical protein